MIRPRSLLFALLFFFLLSACAPAAGEDMPTVLLPSGMAYADGKEIYFIHTEASDSEVANLLSDMMSSPVLHVPSLANVPEESLAEVYVFSNGMEGMGPFGFQADVFDRPPGAEGYSPLRRVNLVSWTDPANARMLKSVNEIMAAEASGELTITQPGVVVNMPFVVWDGGKR